MRYFMLPWFVPNFRPLADFRLSWCPSMENGARPGMAGLSKKNTKDSKKKNMHKKLFVTESDISHCRLYFLY